MSSRDSFVRAVNRDRFLGRLFLRQRWKAFISVIRRRIYQTSHCYHRIPSESALLHRLISKAVHVRTTSRAVEDGPPDVSLWSNGLSISPRQHTTGSRSRSPTAGSPQTYHGWRVAACLSSDRSGKASMHVSLDTPYSADVRTRWWCLRRCPSGSMLWSQDGLLRQAPERKQGARRNARLTSCRHCFL